MKKAKGIFRKRALLAVIYICIFAGPVLPVKAEMLSFTPEEKTYLAKGMTLKAASISGGAPLHYIDSKGEIKGIAVNVLDEIANVSGLVFEYHLYKSISDAINSEPDLLFGLSEKYTPPGVVLSRPYLETETVLYYNKAIDPKQLGDKRYAAISGGTLPEGIKENNTVYFNAREDAINAVESGKADFGFGNAYSLAFYTLQNSYKNIITIPTGEEEREYCIGVSEGNEILLSIINKSIEAIGRNRIDTFVLDVASQVERKVTFSMIIDSYWKVILGLLSLVMAILAYSVFLSLRAKNRIEMENKRYRTLAHVSNELLFEYRIKSGNLHVSEKLNSKIDLPGNKEKIVGLFKKAIDNLKNNDSDGNNYTTELLLSNGDVSIFKIMFSYLKAGNGKVLSIIGKLVDITEEEKEKKQLIIKAQLDGLTGLFNATTAKEVIRSSISNKEENQTDALIVIDCDNFKEINDNHGHLKGDLALASIGNKLKGAFRQTDIIGRIGGDEFCVYMHDIPSVDFVRLRCKELIHMARRLKGELQVDISIGIAICKEQTTYENLFQQADDALYIAKGNGGSQIVVCQE